MLVWATLALPGAIYAAERQPNVVLIMTDDQGYGDLGCHGNPAIRTPNLDKLHSECVRLTNFHVDPTCSPTRAALMTGRYSSRTGVWHTVMGRSIMYRDEKTMANVFENSGYKTAIFGKWHLGDNYPFRAQDRGFQESIVCGGGGITQTPDAWENSYFDDRYLHNGEMEKYFGYCTDVFFNGALRFMEANREQPFFVYLPLNVPHGPFNVAERHSQPYRDRGITGDMADFYGMITQFDENFGRLRSKLRELKIEDNTILIFMTDNGTGAGYVPPGKGVRSNERGYNAGMRGMKGAAFDGGHRVPFFVRWPAGKIAGGKDVSKLAAHIDILPTLIELCALKKPENVQFDGTSLAPLLRDPSAPWPDRTLLVHSQRLDIPEKWKTFAVMTEEWRLVNGKELFDMRKDPGQTENVAAQFPVIFAQLRGRYESWWDDLLPRMNDSAYIVLGNDRENPSRLTCHDWHGCDEGELPWNQRKIKTAPNSNGFWTVEFERDGEYEFKLTQQPLEANFAIQATHARVKIGDRVIDQAVAKGAVSVDIKARVKAGKTELRTWFTDENAGVSRGAFFVYVKRE